MMTYWILPVEKESRALVGGSVERVEQRWEILLQALRAPDMCARAGHPPSVTQKHSFHDLIKHPENTLRLRFPSSAALRAEANANWVSFGTHLSTINE